MNFDANRLARADILALGPYRPQREERKVEDGYICLENNENPFAGVGVNRYPGPGVRALHARLADLYHVAEDNLIVTPGSDEGINLLIRAFCEPGKDNILIAPPTFGMYEFLARIQGAGIVSIPLDAGWNVDFAGMQAALSNNQSIKLVFLCSPQNPVGSTVSPEQIVRLAVANPQCLIVVDEAYQEFSDSESLVGALPQYKNMVVLRTLSKAWGLAGARIGAAIASETVITIVRRVLLPYAVATPSVAQALETLRPAGMARVESEINRIKSERERVSKAMAKAPGVKRVLPSQANFLLVQFDDAVKACARLRARRILTRDMRAAIPGALRIAVGTEEENTLMLAALGVIENKNSDRHGRVERSTRETSIFAEVNLDKAAPTRITTGVAFFDHMLEQLSKHSGIAMTLRAEGDLDIDAHHTVEDCMITLGQALTKALGDKRGIGRYGFSVPMDEARADVIIDLSGRGFCRFDGCFKADHLGALPSEMIAHAVATLAQSLAAAIHVAVTGENDHHKAEAVFKGLGRALKMAVRREGDGLPTTKGRL